MTFIPTSQCPKWPQVIHLPKPPWPIAEIPDDDIDRVLQEMFRKGETPSNIPRTQYGRRAAVALYLKGEERGYDGR